MNELDDFLMEAQCEEYYMEPEEDYEVDNDSYISDSNMAQRRKNRWKYAKRHQRINEELYGDTSSRPLHYFSKTHATSENFDRRKITREKRQTENFENQMNELFDFE